MDPNVRDLKLLDTLRSVLPVWVDGYDDGTIIRWDDIPPNLIALSEMVAPALEPIRTDPWAIALLDRKPPRLATVAMKRPGFLGG